MNHTGIPEQQSLTATQLYELNIRDETYKEVFTMYLNLEYKINDIPINEHQTIHTVFLPCTNREKDICENYYFGHGFGGSSVIHFYLITDLLKKGNVILWELRGMGFSIKLPHYDISEPDKIVQFFIEGICKMLQFYSYQHSSIIGHSLSSYLILHFIMKKQELVDRYIKEVLLLSAVGITTKQEDYKYKSNTCADFFQNVYHRFIWSINSNFKTPFRWLCCQCLRDHFLRKIINGKIQLDEKQAEVMLKISKKFIQLSNGSQNLFFQLFEPRGLPKIPIQPLMIKQPTINITIVYGDQRDWVDKTGATKLAERFPNKIRKLQIDNLSHNITFHTKSCKELFDFVLK